MYQQSPCFRRQQKEWQNNQVSHTCTQHQGQESSLCCHLPNPSVYEAATAQTLHCHLLAVVTKPFWLPTLLTYCRPTSFTAHSEQDLVIGHAAVTACCGICSSLRAALWAGTSSNDVQGVQEQTLNQASCLQGCRIKGKAEKAVFKLKVGIGSMPCGVWAAFFAVLTHTTASPLT